MLFLSSGSFVRSFIVRVWQCEKARSCMYVFVCLHACMHGFNDESHFGTNENLIDKCEQEIDRKIDGANEEGILSIF